MLYVGNVLEGHASDPTQSKYYNDLVKFAQEENINTMGISLAIESEIAQLPIEDREMFLSDIGIKETGLSRLTRSSFELLNLATYFTAGVQEVRAWTFKQGATAPECAGIIHTDFERGFIRAEIIGYDDFIKHGGEKGSKESGKSRLEGKEYIVKDGDIIHFLFNV